MLFDTDGHLPAHYQYYLWR